MKNTFSKRLGSMLKVDFKRLFLSRSFYIIVATSLLAPILILVMTTMMDGSVSVNPQTGEETVIEGFDNVWQIIGSVSDPNASASGDMSAMSMDIVSMCNINMGILRLPRLFVSSLPMISEADMQRTSLPSERKRPITWHPKLSC